MTKFSYVPGDILCWTEPVLAPPTQKRGKREQIGQQKLTARLRAIAEVCDLEVMGIDILSAPVGFQPSIKPGDMIRRREASLQAGACKNIKTS